MTTSASPQAAEAGPAASELPPTALDIRLFRLSFERMIQQTAAVWLICFFLAAGAWRQAADKPFFYWCVAILLAFTLRTTIIKLSPASAWSAQDLHTWRLRYVLLTLGCGVVVGAGPAMLLPTVPEALRIYVTMVMCCWLSGAMATLGTMPKLYLAYGILFVAGLSVGWLRTGTPFVFDMIVMLANYVVLVVMFGAGYGRHVRMGLAIRFENERLIDELRTAKLIAEESSTAKSRFLAVASHDLRQPLHALMMLNGLLARPHTADRTFEIAGQMSRSLSTLDRLFSSVLDFSKLEASTVRPELRWISLNALMDRLVQEYQPVAAARGISLYACAPPLEVQTDPALLERILRNLMDNALKFTEQGGIRIDAMQDEQSILVTVVDTGIGIPEHLREDIFKEFVQAHENSSGGLGLGLAIVRRLSGLLGIEVQVEGNLPFGTRFALRFPAGAGRTADAESSPLPLETDALISLEGLRVLCVDDDVASLHAMRELLSEWGCVVVTAESPSQALEIAGRHPAIDVVLSDYAMGEQTNGESLIHALRKRLGEIPGALITGDLSVARAHQEGRIEYPVLTKPVSTRDLRQLLEVFKEMA